MVIMKKLRTYISTSIYSSSGRGPYCFRIHGQIYHNTAPMDKNTKNPKYGDLYFMDSSQALEYRTIQKLKQAVAET